MIVEYVRYELKAHAPQLLIDAYAQAGEHLRAAPECFGYELTQCEDAPSSVILRIIWESTEAHTLGFRKGPHFLPFLAIIRPFIEEIAEMRHYARTPVEWSRG
jgi:quinol monooxygenase YgiN